VSSPADRPQQQQQVVVVVVAAMQQARGLQMPRLVLQQARGMLVQLLVGMSWRSAAACCCVLLARQHAWCSWLREAR
jgi:hypothetical protein